MKRKKERVDAEETINELVDAYREHLREIFAKDTFELSFDEREKLIDGKVQKERNRIIEEHIEKDPEGISKNNNNPDETSLCACKTEGILCRDKEGKVKIFKRTIQTKRGPVKIKEYGYYCTKCRKIFFPSPKDT